MDFLTDIHINGDRDVHLDDANDLALVSGTANVEQSVAIAAGDAIEEFIGGPIDGNTLGLLEERLRQTLDDDPQVADVWNVSVEEFDRRDGSITLDVFVDDDDDFTIEVT